MRSRYCAFVLGNSNYLLQTWHADTRPAQLVLSPDVSWFGLEIVAIEAGEAQDSEGRVEFMAKFNGHDRLQYLHERSRFVREDGRWFYVDGESVPQAKAPKIGRNEPCPCGSGKKYKRCCG
jgi:SEC-C motif-containing protein